MYIPTHKLLRLQKWNSHFFIKLFGDLLQAATVASVFLLQLIFGLHFNVELLF